MGRCLFIRDDDIWTLDREFRFFFDAAKERDIPVVYAVIPGKMDRETIRFLCDAKERTPHLLDIVQHGWMHRNYSDSRAKYEFGPSRSLEDQRQDIKEGLKEMKLAFSDHFTPAFVPPYHGYDARTLQILDEEGFQIFSVGNRRFDLKKRFLDLPAQVSFTTYGHTTTVHSANEVMRDLIRGSLLRPLSGVLFHHADFTTEDRRKELIKFFDGVAALKTKENWRTVLFSEMLSGVKG